MKEFKIILLTLFLGTLIQTNTSAKETKKNPDASNASSLEQGPAFPDSSSWILTRIVGIKTKKMHIANKAFILIQKSDQKLSGFTSCNFIKGIVTIQDSTISFTGVSPCKKQCDEATNMMEKIFRETLQKSNSWKIADNKLYLYENGSLILEFKSAIGKD
jgi:heat shock protein HslJ